MEIYPVIMAGGSGTRFWPASRTRLPKQFLEIIGKKTMVEQTLERIGPVCREENIIIVGNAGHHDLLKKASGQRRAVILKEPFGRNTAPCIGYAAVYLKAKGLVKEPMAIMPSDHYIKDEDRFRSVLTKGARLASRGAVVTIGIVPTRPETGYGYMKRGTVREETDGIATFSIEEFVEKPDRKTALKYLESGDYFWNGGIFLFTPELILKEMENHLPEVYEGLLKIEASMDRPDHAEKVRSVYETIPSISIDRGIMEKTKAPVLCIPGDFGWSDVGSWESLYELRRHETDGDENLIQGESLLVDTESSFVFNQDRDRIVIGLGLKDLVIVNTGDVVFVGDLKKSQDIKKVLEEIAKKGKTSVL